MWMKQIPSRDDYSFFYTTTNPGKAGSDKASSDTASGCYVVGFLFFFSKKSGSFLVGFFGFKKSACYLVRFLFFSPDFET